MTVSSSFSIFFLFVASLYVELHYNQVDSFLISSNRPTWNARSGIKIAIERTTTPTTGTSKSSLQASPTPFQKLTAQWIQQEQELEQQQPKPPRSGHVSFSIDDSLFVFGGYVEEKEEDGTMKRYPTNDLWERKKYKSKDGDDEDDEYHYMWECVEQNGDVPEERLVSAVSVLDGKAYLFGGWNPNNIPNDNIILDTVHSFDSQTKTWSKLDCSIPDGPTSRHVAVTLSCQTKALLHNHRCCDGFVYIFDSKTQSFTKQKTTGTSPSSRGLHAACILDTTHLVLFGGAHKSGDMSNETFLLNLSTWNWTKVHFDNGENESSKMKQNFPSVRAAPCLVSYDESHVILYGGAQAVENVGLVPLDDVWTLHIDKDQSIGSWQLLITSNNNDDDDIQIPPGRNAATMDVITLPFSLKDKYACNDENTKHYLLFGGWAPFRTTWNDSYILSVKSE